MGRPNLDQWSLPKSFKLENTNFAATNQNPDAGEMDDELDQLCSVQLKVRSVFIGGCIVGAIYVLFKLACQRPCQQLPPLLSHGFAWILWADVITLCQHLSVQLFDCFEIDTSRLSPNLMWSACYIWTFILDASIALPQYVQCILMLEFSGIFSIRAEGYNAFNVFACTAWAVACVEFISFWPEQHLSLCALDASILRIIAPNQLVTILIIPTAFVSAWSLAMSMRLIVKRVLENRVGSDSSDHNIALFLIIFSLLKLTIWIPFLNVQLLIKGNVQRTVIMSEETKNFLLRIGAFSDWLAVAFFCSHLPEIAAAARPTAV